MSEQRTDDHEFGGLDTDADGWDFSRCDCGWVSPPCPDTDTAVEFWGDHIMEANDRLRKPSRPRCRRR